MTYEPRTGGRYIRDPKTGECVREGATPKPDPTPKTTAKPKAEKD